MRIYHNLPSLTANNALNRTQSGMQRSIARLSTGLRINSASDDAAGLAVSEKMRAQIRGLDQAARNTQDGISMIQTAEGALSEAHSMLQRMRELSVQAANDTLTAQGGSCAHIAISGISGGAMAGNPGIPIDIQNPSGNSLRYNMSSALNGSVSGVHIPYFSLDSATGNVAVGDIVVDFFNLGTQSFPHLPTYDFTVDGSGTNSTVTTNIDTTIEMISHIFQTSGFSPKMLAEDRAFYDASGKFKPQHLGQLEFYLEALDRDVKKPNENPSVGVALPSCRPARTRKKI